MFHFDRDLPPAGRSPDSGPCGPSGPRCGGLPQLQPLLTEEDVEPEPPPPQPGEVFALFAFVLIAHRDLLPALFKKRGCKYLRDGDWRRVWVIFIKSPFVLWLYSYPSVSSGQTAAM